MGACVNKPSKTVRNDSKRADNQDASNNKGVNSVELDKETYPDMEEWDGDRYTGEGIKRMKGYKCSLPINDLNKKREDFWSIYISLIVDNKLKSSQVWKYIKQSCIMDHSNIKFNKVRSSSLLKTHRLTPVDGCISLIQDHYNNFYRVPNYCINDPFFEKELLAVDDNKETKTINITIYDLYQNKKTDISVDENILCGKLKLLFCERNQINQNDFKIRILFGGVEMKDENHLYQYKLQDGYTIQILQNPIKTSSL